MNIVNLSGYVASDPRTFKNSVTVFNLSVGRGKNKEGESLGYDYIHMKAFGGCGEFITNKVFKGDYVVIEGKLHTDEYEGKQTTEVIIQRIEPAKSYVKTESDTYSSSVWGD